MYQRSVGFEITADCANRMRRRQRNYVNYARFLKQKKKGVNTFLGTSHQYYSRCNVKNCGETRRNLHWNHSLTKKTGPTHRTNIFVVSALKHLNELIRMPSGNASFCPFQPLSLWGNSLTLKVNITQVWEKLQQVWKNDANIFNFTMKKAIPRGESRNVRNKWRCQFLTYFSIFWSQKGSIFEFCDQFYVCM